MSVFAVGDIVECVKQKEYFAFTHSVGDLHAVSANDVDTINTYAQHYKKHVAALLKRYKFKTSVNKGITLKEFSALTSEMKDDCVLEVDPEFQIEIYDIMSETTEEYMKRRVTVNDDYSLYLKLKAKFE